MPPLSHVDCHASGRLVQDTTKQECRRIQVHDKTPTNTKPALHLGPPVLNELLCREQFAISQSTDEYDKLLSQIPGEFVGTGTRLRPLVKLLCLKMEQAFQDTGLTRPPWRQPESMLSKWLPSKVGLPNP